MRLRLIILAMFAMVLPMAAQELNCNVEVNTSQIQGTNKSVFETLQQAMNDYMNNTQFTNAQFAANEKIDCRLFFNIKEVDGDKMSGDLQIQSSRPVYNSTYLTTLINFKDQKIDFDYQEGEPLIFSLNSMQSQLTAILNFYAYLIIAVDFDSFSPHGGDEAFEILRQIVQFGQSSGESGWKAFEDTKNRAAVLNAFTEPQTSGIRDLYYNYHRRGLDEMSMAPDKGRAQITSSLEALSKVYSVAPTSVALSMWRDAKLDELVNVYTKGSQTERQTVVDILSPLYPTEMDRINKIKNGTNK